MFRCIRRLAAFLFSLVVVGVAALGGVASAAIADLAVHVHPSLAGVYNVVVTFDASVCRGPAHGSLLPEFQPPAGAVVQARVDGAVVSIVVDPEAGAAGCAKTLTWHITLPGLKAGAYSVRVAEASLSTGPTFYLNTVVGPARVTTFTAVSFEPSAASPIYQLDTGYLSIYDGGAARQRNSVASAGPSWQSAFYGWVAAEPLRPPPGMRELRVLSFAGPDGQRRPFYTIDTPEYLALLATGVFAAVTEPSRILVIAPAGGSCEPGRVAIYRAFDAVSVRHRYVPVSNYRALLANGWSGDGVVFCAAQPTANGAGDDWAPN